MPRGQSTMPAARARAKLCRQFKTPEEYTLTVTVKARWA